MLFVPRVQEIQVYLANKSLRDLLLDKKAIFLAKSNTKFHAVNVLLLNRFYVAP